MSCVSPPPEAASTVTAQDALLPPHVAVTVHAPAFTAVTTPPLTVAKSAGLTDQLTVLLVALSGFTVAVSVSLFPSVSVSALLLRLTLFTGTITTSPSPFHSVFRLSSVACMFSLP